MSFGAIVLLALGLAMDAAAVSATRGLALPRIAPRHVLLVAGFFGGFQMLMPLIGWLLGRRVGPVLQAWDHWIAFGLLVGLGGKLLWDAWGADRGDESQRSRGDPFAPRVMFVLAVATSIDALAVGFTLPLLKAPLLLSILTIGVTTAIMSTLALFAGRRFDMALGRRLDAVGGIVLMGLGTKILIEHLAGGG